MTSFQHLSRWLLIVAMCMTTVLGCETEEEKAENQAAKANAYIKEQNNLRQDLIDNYKVGVPKTGFLSQSDLTGFLSSYYVPSCVKNSDRDTINAKLNRVITLSNAIQKIMASENVKYSGPRSDFEHVKQNAALVRDHLVSVSTCTTIAVMDPNGKITTTTSGDNDSSAEAVHAQLIADTNRLLGELEDDQNIIIVDDQVVTVNDIVNRTGDEMLVPVCMSQDDKVTAQSKLEGVSSNVQQIFLNMERLRSTDSIDSDQIQNVGENAENMKDVVDMIAVCR